MSNRKQVEGPFPPFGYMYRVGGRSLCGLLPRQHRQTRSIGTGTRSTARGREDVSQRRELETDRRAYRGGVRQPLRKKASRSTSLGMYSDTRLRASWAREARV
jgi:hypothetical protein